MKSVLFGVWFLLVVVVIGAICEQDRFFAHESKAIALLADKAGSVMERTPGLIRWDEMARGQGFHDGDRVATARASKAKVQFNQERTLLLGEDTQVQITAMTTANRQRTYMITLIRGTVSAESKCRHCPPLVIRAGDETFSVDGGKKVALAKVVGKKVRKLDPQTPISFVSKSVPAAPVLAANFVKALPPPAPPPPPPAPPPPAPVAKAKGFEAIVRVPSTGLVYWTTEPLMNLVSAAIDFPLSAPPQRPEVGDWRPIAELSGPNPARNEIIETTGPMDFRLKISVSKIRSLGSSVWKDGYREYTLGIRGGARVSIKGQAQPSQSFSDRKLELKVRTYGEFPGGPATIGLDRLTASNEPGPWLVRKNEIKPEDAPIAIHLATSQDYAKFIPYIKGAAGVGISRQGLYSNDGIFVVRKQEVVAQLRGSGMTQERIEKLMELLGGDFVFEGPRSALHDTRGASQNALVDWIGALLDKGQVLYILKRNKLYPVSRDFIKTNNEVAKFVDSQAKAVFLERVKILDYR